MRKSEVEKYKNIIYEQKSQQKKIEQTNEKHKYKNTEKIVQLLLFIYHFSRPLLPWSLSIVVYLFF